MHNSKIRKKISENILRFIFIITSLVVVIPIIWAIATSFKTSAEFLTSPWSLPANPQFVNYINAFTKANMGMYFVNSIAITFVSLILLFCLAVPASYALARFKFRFNKTLNLLFMAGLFISASYIVVPLFLILKDINSLDNRLMICIVYAATTLPFNIYLLSGFMKGIPYEYEEAAKVDGCGYLQTLIRIIMPMCKPGLVTVAVFGFMSYWNEYMLALTLLTTPEKRTLSVGLRNLMEIQKFATDWGAMFAGLVMVMLPTMIFYALVQKKLTAGIGLGGLKG